MTYKDLMLRYARIRKLKRKVLLLPGIPVWFMAFGVDLMTPVPHPIAHALIDGLSADSIVKHPAALQIFPEVRLIDFDSATQDALEKTHPAHIERMWDMSKNSGSLLGQTSEVSFIKHEGCFILHAETEINKEPEKIIQTIVNLRKTPPFPASSPTSSSLSVRATHLRSARGEEGPGVRAHRHNSFGEQWIEWRVGRTGSPACLTQTLFFSPYGLPGFLYWFLSYPFQRFSFRGLIREIAKQCQNS